jgi:hypothetical protein
MRRPLLIATLGLLAIVIALSLARDEHHGRDWASWLPGQARHSFAHSPCGIPVHFILGEVDPRFGFDRDTVMTALVEAANLWQALSDRVLFLDSDHRYAMPVSLRFDQRQQAANTRRSLRGNLERDRLELEGAETLLLEWHERIDAAKREFDRATGRLARAELERMLADLNADISAYNRRATDMQQRAEDFRARVGRYNEATAGAPVESGRYSYNREDGRRIEVFRAESFDELVWVLAHELGHALGIDHVADPGSVMHAMLHDGGELNSGRARPVTLGAADHAALAEVCGAAVSGKAPRATD